MQQISPKKYIETKVRTLPIGMCYINENWEECGIANVIITRNHTNGKVSGAMYLIDLMCLGVKDTSWFFNEYDNYFEDKFENFNINFVKIDYNLAHNIIYAGYDFAMEFDIQPHKEFATSRFVLEEDNDEIPIIDIKVGEGPDDKPHLMVYNKNEFLDALAKLKKNAGEGNYYYTFMDSGNLDKNNYEDEDEDEYEDDDEDEYEDDEIDLDEIEENNLTFETIKNVRTLDLLDDNKIIKRNEFEKLICLTESMLRIVIDLNTNNENEETKNIYNIRLNGWYNIERTIEYPNGITKDEYGNGLDDFNKYIEKENNSPINEVFFNISSLENNNTIFLVLLFLRNLEEIENAQKVIERLEKCNSLIIVSLITAFYHLYNSIEHTDSTKIIESNIISNAFENHELFSDEELVIYYALQTIKHVSKNNMPAAIANYKLLTYCENTYFHEYICVYLWIKFIPALEKYVKEIFPEQLKAFNK